MRIVLLLSLLLALGCNRQTSRIGDTTDGPYEGTAPAASPAPRPATPDGNSRQLREEDNPDLRATIETARSNGETEENQPRTISPRNPNYDARRQQQKQAAAQPGNPDAEPGATNPAQRPPLPAINPKDLSARPLVALRKTPCYGDCPVYTITVLTSELATLDAKRGTQKAGKQLRPLKYFEYADLATQVSKVTGGELADRYPVEGEVPTDIAFTELTFTDEDGQQRVVKVYADAPEPVAELIETLTELATGYGWQ